MNDNKNNDHPTIVKPNRFEKLSFAEKKVYKALSEGKAQPDDVSAISKACHLTDFQVKLALHLLSLKRLIPKNSRDPAY
jgi:hypothetical protein